MNPWIWSAIVAGVLFTSGCQSHPLRDPEGTDASASNGADALSALSDQAKRTSEKLSAGPPTPTGDLTLADVLSLAVAHHPRLDAYSVEIRAAEARAIQAGRWPNPELEVELENVAGSGHFAGIDAAESTLSLAQTFPLGDDIARRRELADIRTQQAIWRYEMERLSVLLEATQRFINALAADRRIELAQSELELARATQRLTLQRVEAGEVSPVERTRVIVPVITAEIALQRARRERESAYRRVAMSWGGREVTFEAVRAQLEGLGPLPAPQQLVRLINDNPQVAHWATRISAHVAEQHLVEAEAAPDLIGRIGVKHHNENDDVAFVLGISLPLPVFDRRQGDVLAARWGAESARQRQRDAELRLESMLSSSYADLAGAHDEVIALRDKALPAATDALQATQQAFEEGEFPFIDVLDAQRTLFELQARYVDALVAYHTAAAEIESLIGRRLSELNDPQPVQETEL